VLDLVSEGIVEAKLLDRAPRQPGDDRLIRLVAGIAAAAPDRTLQQIAAQLEAMRERTPRGGTRWHPSSVSEGRRLSRPRAERRRSAARQIHRFVASAEPIVRSTVTVSGQGCARDIRPPPVRARRLSVHA
jgi:hypothetical protein